MTEQDERDCQQIMDALTPPPRFEFDTKMFEISMAHLAEAMKDLASLSNGVKDVISRVQYVPDTHIGKC